MNPFSDQKWIHFRVRNESIFGAKMTPFAGQKWIHLRVTNGSISLPCKIPYWLLVNPKKRSKPATQYLARSWPDPAEVWPDSGQDLASLWPAPGQLRARKRAESSQEFRRPRTETAQQARRDRTGEDSIRKGNSTDSASKQSYSNPSSIRERHRKEIAHDSLRNLATKAQQPHIKRTQSSNEPARLLHGNLKASVRDREGNGKQSVSKLDGTLTDLVSIL